MDKIPVVAWVVLGLLLMAGYFNAAVTNLQAPDVILISMSFVYCFALGGTVGRRMLINQLYPKEES